MSQLVQQEFNSLPSKYISIFCSIYNLLQVCRSSSSLPDPEGLIAHSTQNIMSSVCSWLAHSRIKLRVLYHSTRKYQSHTHAILLWCVCNVMGIHFLNWASLALLLNQSPNVMGIHFLNWASLALLLNQSPNVMGIHFLNWAFLALLLNQSPNVMGIHFLNWASLALLLN